MLINCIAITSREWATLKQVSDTRTLKSISLTKQNTDIFAVQRYKKYKHHCGSSLFDVFALNKTLFSDTNFHVFVTKLFLNHKESPLDVALFFVLYDFDGSNEVSTYKVQQFFKVTTIFSSSTP